MTFLKGEFPPEWLTADEVEQDNAHEGHAPMIDDDGEVHPDLVQHNVAPESGPDQPPNKRLRLDANILSSVDPDLPGQPELDSDLTGEDLLAKLMEEMTDSDASAEDEENSTKSNLVTQNMQEISHTTNASDLSAASGLAVCAAFPRFAIPFSPRSCACY